MSGLAIDPSHLRGNGFRFTEEENQLREINNRRLAASERRLRIERESAPLFADQIAALQPTALERLQSMDAATQERFAHWDQKRQETWEEALARIAELSVEQQNKFLAYWNTSPVPSDPAYMLMAVRRFVEGKIDLEAIVDRSYITDPEKRRRAEKLDKSLRNLHDIV